ncbi:PREDICTED: uncharacterized protein LOC105460638 isoform X2 [Wasmannia auropunctata]|uniref:uncharacterized protein LOC105460638 isoform X2 n=1 Tax=Wasmannia auropunctata TaxID=64793 RepID=UPI0005EF67A9|nr:PREDICTED: uncharacterized protein LOC105460638 isoform X2 [Wasmannia auropunctata]
MDTINANCQEDLESLSSNSFENMERKNVHNRKSKATIEQKTEDDKQIPIRLWIGRHFTKLTGEESKCNYCILKFFIYDNDNDYEKFQCHLVKEHPDKLADDKKEKDKFSWIWDYYTLENNIHAMCNFCGNNIKLYNKSEYTLETHLKVYHGITGADSNTDDASNDANKDTDLCKNTENTGSQIAKRFGAKTYNAILAYDDGNLPYVRLQRL